jgi:hypothetical protein
MLLHKHFALSGSFHIQAAMPCQQTRAMKQNQGIPLSGWPLGPVCFCVSKALLIKFENFLFFY